MRRELGTSLLAGTICLTTAAVCAAQSSSPVPELVTDRPDFTESSEVVGHRVVQIESGLRLEKSDAATRQVSTPQVLVRVGLGSWFELRFAGDGYVSQSVQTPNGQVRTNGHSDLELGAKVKFLTADAAGLDMAVIPFVSLPTASEGFGSTGYDPGFKLTWARELPLEFGLSGDFNLASVTGDAGRDLEKEISVSLGHSLGGAWGMYWEGYGAIAGGACDCTVNTGVSRGFGANSQIDIEVGRGVSGAAQDWFVGVGFAVRRLHR